MTVFNHQKYIFKLAIQFSHMLIKVDVGYKKTDIKKVQFDIHYVPKRVQKSCCG